MTTCVLQHIEEHRTGGDVKLQFQSRVLILKMPKVNYSKFSEIEDIKTIGVPFETTFVGEDTDRFEYTIAQSEWIKMLRNLMWSELEILELPSSKLRSVQPLGRALKRFEDAQECYRRGDWEATMLNCRKVYEAIVQDHTGTHDMSQAEQVYTSLIGEGVKAERFSSMARSLGNFLHLGRHENLPDVLISRADSQLALLLTGALLKYLGEQ